MRHFLCVKLRKVFEIMSHFFYAKLRKVSENMRRFLYGLPHNFAESRPACMYAPYWRIHAGGIQVMYTCIYILVPQMIYLLYEDNILVLQISIITVLVTSIINYRTVYARFGFHSKKRNFIFYKIMECKLRYFTFQKCLQAWTQFIHKEKYAVSNGLDFLTQKEFHLLKKIMERPLCLFAFQRCFALRS